MVSIIFSDDEVESVDESIDYNYILQAEPTDLAVDVLNRSTNGVFESLLEERMRPVENVLSVMASPSKTIDTYEMSTGGSPSRTNTASARRTRRSISKTPDAKENRISRNALRTPISVLANRQLKLQQLRLEEDQDPEWSPLTEQQIRKNVRKLLLDARENKPGPSTPAISQSPDDGLTPSRLLRPRRKQLLFDDDDNDPLSDIIEKVRSERRFALKSRLNKAADEARGGLLSDNFVVNRSTSEHSNLSGATGTNPKFVKVFRARIPQPSLVVSSKCLNAARKLLSTTFEDPLKNGRAVDDQFNDTFSIPSELEIDDAPLLVSKRSSEKMLRRGKNRLSRTSIKEGSRKRPIVLSDSDDEISTTSSGSSDHKPLADLFPHRKSSRSRCAERNRIVKKARIIQLESDSDDDLASVHQRLKKRC